jgi:hypothetical protein
MAMINILIALLEKVCEESHEDNNKEVLKTNIYLIGQRVEECCQVLRSELGKKDKEKVEKHFKEFNEQVLAKNMNIITIMSLCLGLLSDLASHIKDPKRINAIDQLENALWHLHSFLDSPINQSEAYKEADRAIKVWYKLSG